jgi:L,D-transpeptidase YcbB
MYQLIKPVPYILVFTLISFTACKRKGNSGPVTEKVVSAFKSNDAIGDYLQSIFTKDNPTTTLSDSSKLYYYKVLKSYYQQNNYDPIWTSRKNFTKQANALMAYMDTSILQGLFKEDYHYNTLKKLKIFLEKDSLDNATQVMWSNAELMMTDALVGMLRDLKQGRLQDDSLSWGNDSAKIANYFLPNITKVNEKERIDTLLAGVQPKHKEYVALKSGIKKYVDSMDTHEYTYVTYPMRDSNSLRKELKKRLAESDILLEANADSTAIAKALKSFQIKYGLKADGQFGASVAKKMNASDKLKLYNIAITLDRYKQLPEVMPERYIWVNIPSYHLKVVDTDTIALESKVIVGKVLTPTPTLSSKISDIVLYPTWTVPSSIIEKDLLPSLKKNPNALARRGLYLVGGSGRRINPANINWNKYKKAIPYMVQQASGDRNALGIIKFNFENPYAVYLHDTNQRYLFENSFRCLSHGCVRVQEWKALSNYIVRNDSLRVVAPDTIKFNTDSVRKWMATKNNRTLKLKQNIPLFIRYFSCEMVNGKIKFYDDVYADDRDLKQLYFAKK